MSTKSPKLPLRTPIKPATEPNLLEAASEVAKVDEMNKYGIKCISVPYYLYGKFRYTNIEDALSQAKRDYSDK